MSDGSSLCIPRGFRASGVTAGLKASGLPDLAVLASDGPAAAAGTFTLNRVCAAPVKWCREQASGRRHPRRRDQLRQRQRRDRRPGAGKRPAHGRARRQRAWVASADQVLVASTGVIGHQLPMDRIEAGLEQAVACLGADTESFQAAAAAIMTTDTRPKIVSLRASRSAAGR